MEDVLVPGDMRPVLAFTREKILALMVMPALWLPMMMSWGQLKKHHHVREGRNSRMDTLQAAILLAKLPYIDQWTNARIKKAALYNKLLKDSGLIVPATKNNYTHVFHLYVIRTEKREALQAYLKDHGVETAVHYPTALPLLPCYHSYGYQSADFPIAFHNQARILSLPIYAEITNEQIEYVARLIKNFY